MHQSVATEQSDVHSREQNILIMGLPELSGDGDRQSHAKSQVMEVLEAFRILKTKVCNVYRFNKSNVMSNYTSIVKLSTYKTSSSLIDVIITNNIFSLEYFVINCPFSDHS